MLLIGALAVTVVLSGCSLLPREEDTLSPPLVQPAEEKLDTVTVAKGNIETFLTGTASFVSSKVETLSFKGAGGQLKSINVQLGQEVKAGDLLTELETGDLELQAGMQRLNVERAQLLYSDARASNASAIDLRLRLIDLEREQMSLKAMESHLDQSRLYAPIAGTVIFIDSLKTGDRVSPYQSVVTVADPSGMQLTYAASDTKDVQQVVAGMPVSLKYKGKDYTGKVLQSPADAPLTADKTKADHNAVTIVIGIDHPLGGIQLGDSAEISIPLQKRENVIVLPRAAVRTYMGRFYVQVAEGDRRKEVDVEAGLTTPTEVEIVKGLKEGQKVILNN